MPTLAGMRRRGYTAEAIREFCERIGVAKRDSVVDMELLEHCVREDLNLRAPRAMAVMRPLKVIIDNFPEAKTEEFAAPNHPQDPGMGSRKIPFGRELYIEQDDFLEKAPKGFFRLAPGREVRLRNAYFITCERVVKDEKTGEIREIHCTYDPATRDGYAPDKRKVKATIHWVSADHCLKAEVRLYDRLFAVANPGAEAEKDGADFSAFLNQKSLETLTQCYVEPSLAKAAPEGRYQFERLGYFCVDAVDSSANKLVFNRTVTLRDTWAKIMDKEQ
jgi:glutaminyl-tRNA synthetase